MPNQPKFWLIPGCHHQRRILCGCTLIHWKHNYKIYFISYYNYVKNSVLGRKQIIFQDKLFFCITSHDSLWVYLTLFFWIFLIIDKKRQILSTADYLPTSYGNLWLGIVILVSRLLFNSLLTIISINYCCGEKNANRDARIFLPSLVALHFSSLFQILV